MQREHEMGIKVQSLELELLVVPGRQLRCVAGHHVVRGSHVAKGLTCTWLGA
jgi:hypothetical protein